VEVGTGQEEDWERLRWSIASLRRRIAGGERLECGALVVLLNTSDESGFVPFLMGMVSTGEEGRLGGGHTGEAAFFGLALEAFQGLVLPGSGEETEETRFLFVGGPEERRLSWRRKEERSIADSGSDLEPGGSEKRETGDGVWPSHVG